jgi:phage terminase large subunit GpA-like protein
MPACGYTLEYFEEIISEQRELTYNKSGFAEYKWTKNRTDPNEALDCRNYARAALEYLRIRLEQMSRDVVTLLPKDVDRVEIGTERFIYVQKSDVKTRHRAGYSRYGSSEPVTEQSQPTIRGTAQFGAGGDTSF